MTRKNAVWYDQHQVVEEERHDDILVEVVTNGTFCAIAPDGDAIETDGYVADWLIKHGITNDEELNAAMEGAPENGWTFSLSRVFDCVAWLVHEADGLQVRSEINWEVMGTEYDEEMFKAAVHDELDRLFMEGAQ